MSELGKLNCRIDILSLFPEYFEGPFQVSMLKRAQEKGLIEIGLHDIRQFGVGKHRKVDERPFGGGPGMVLMPKPVCDAIRNVKREDSRVIALSAQGKRFTAEKAKELSTYSHLILVCGHYEGIDERVIEKEVDEEISIGDYVLTNGCIGAIVLVDALSRFIPGVLGNEEGALKDSFQNDEWEGPQYTRPIGFEGTEVPKVLLSGHHAEIDAWKKLEGRKKRSRYQNG